MKYGTYLRKANKKQLLRSILSQSWKSGFWSLLFNGFHVSPERFTDTSIVGNIFALGIFSIYLQWGKKSGTIYWELMVVVYILHSASWSLHKKEISVYCLCISDKYWIYLKESLTYEFQNFQTFDKSAIKLFANYITMTI